MSYQTERDGFIATMTREGLDLETIRALLRAATTLQRYAELACSSEAADRDRVPCPRALAERKYACKPIAGAVKAFERYPCLCDYDSKTGQHGDIPRITLQGDRLERRLAARLAALRRVQTDEDAANARAGSDGQPWNPPWELDTQGDPRGYVLRVIPPSYGGRNQGKDRHNREAIGVPSGETRVRF